MLQLCMIFKIISVCGRITASYDLYGGIKVCTCWKMACETTGTHSLAQSSKE